MPTKSGAAGDSKYEQMIAQTINRRKKKQQKMSGDKQRALEFEDKYRAQIKVSEKLEKRVGDYDARLRELQMTIARKEQLYRDSINQVHSARAGAGGDEFRLSDCQQIHDQILSHLEDKKYSTKALILEKERELIRDYEAQVGELRLEVARLKTKNIHGTDEWIARIRKLEEENIWMKQVADKIQSENKKVTQSNAALTQQISTLEADREFLIKQVIAIKKENKHLHLLILEGEGPNTGNNATDSHAHAQATEQLAHLRPKTTALPMSERSPASRRNKLLRHRGAGRARPKSASALAMSSVRSGGNYDSFAHYHTVDSAQAKHEIDGRYHAVIAQLKKQLAAERRKSQHSELKLNRQRSEQNQLQTFLRQCMGDVHKEIAQYMTRQRNRGQRLSSPEAKKGRHSHRRKKALRLRPKSAITVSRKKRSARAHKARHALYSHRDHGQGHAQQKDKDNTHTATLDEMRSEFSLQRFDDDDKKQVLRKLLTKDKILDILYAEMFPTARSIITKRFETDKAMANPVQLASFSVEEFVKRRSETVQRQSRQASEEQARVGQQLEFVKKVAAEAFD